MVFGRAESVPRVMIHADNYGESWEAAYPSESYGKHPLLEATVGYMGLPDDVSAEISIFSEAPGGCSTGTSAAVTVALIAALDRLTPGQLTPHEIAAAAHRIETERLGQQSGIQDQIASAYGGINYIDMYEYPHATVSRLEIAPSLWWELESRLSLIYVGQTHSSSATHDMVIRSLENAGPDAPQLRAIREMAERSKNALYAGDFAALGRAMADCTEAQRNLHPALIGPRHQEIITVARQHGAIGWKVNGAGGEGGSVTLLSSPDRREQRRMLAAVLEASREYRLIPVSLSRPGVRSWPGATLTQ